MIIHLRIHIIATICSQTTRGGGGLLAVLRRFAPNGLAFCFIKSIPNPNEDFFIKTCDREGSLARPGP